MCMIKEEPSSKQTPILLSLQIPRWMTFYRECTAGLRLFSSSLFFSSALFCTAGKWMLMLIFSAIRILMSCKEYWIPKIFKIIPSNEDPLIVKSCKKWFLPWNPDPVKKTRTMRRWCKRWKLLINLVCMLLFCGTFIVLYALIQVDAILNFYESVANIVNFDAFLCLKLAQSKETGP